MSDDWVFSLKEVLKNRYAKKMSISELARRSGIARSTLSRIANNHTNGFNLTTINRICHVLSCHPGDLFRPAIQVLDRDEARARAIKSIDN
jgi:DNA-binding Xre family transcriptional regulator